eukprot:Rhum_TRINITY_DN10595_c0_g2::Rhum_TRINITY_DN10595_c0_g2_i1::g.39147::m.39147
MGKKKAASKDEVVAKEADTVKKTAAAAKKEATPEAKKGAGAKKPAAEATATATAAAAAAAPEKAKKKKAKKPAASGAAAAAAVHDDDIQPEETLAGTLEARKIDIFNFAERLEDFARFRDLLLAPESRDVLKKFAFTTLCMLVLPVTSFYMSIDLFVSLGFDEQSASTYGAVVALLATLCVQTGYVIMALCEEAAAKQKAA